LEPLKPRKLAYMLQKIDLADRSSSSNEYYPDPIIKNELDTSSGIFYMSRPLERAISVNGFLTAMLSASINKKDMDIGMTFYEVTSSGKYFQLSYVLQRASYAADMARRKLLEPGVKVQLPVERSRMVSKMLEKGSRLLVVLNIDKNPFAQVNYGTGKEVSSETISDAGEPLLVKWFNESYIQVPVSFEH
ncbi:MAG: CocE/NonD family hydrolase C-terminal non-catalytic domain-containing protein, partial [Bacteroidia bacterium]